ncbi:MAG TPA: hypothetical protein DCE42_28195 [Myxococcales bacterium]|nr:hypothetical protein [Deltaproteobacteria bacterium]MBU53501.1 hypothetical protein [Deltaproteobacteria bacterium]HAA58676.1 hypothetical protein [Myxococcales bacterium]|tara:strand:- start:23575 stop:24180 length:606 start_codon:yes stop_codon:yes gene_type:complete
MTTIQDAFGARAVRGALINTKVPLALAFQFNPIQITFDKKPNYEIDNVPGFDAPIVTWTSGGPKFISFDLLFDRTQGSVDSNLVKVVSPLVGTLGVEAVLESFIRQRGRLIDQISGKETNQPPPDCLFVFGVRWWKCKLLTAPINEILFNGLLVPERCSVPIKLVVLEEGTSNRINKRMRASLAAQESTLGLASTLLTQVI